jgi:excisionase family DNA binding protein
MRYTVPYSLLRGEIHMDKTPLLPRRGEVIELPPILMTRQDAAKALALSLTEIDKLLSSGALRSARYGRNRMIFRSSLEAFAERLADDNAT